MPYKILKNWIESEKKEGAPNPCQAVLSTVSSDNTPHSRVVAIREINEKGLLFFTQRNTRKVTEIKENPKANLTFWLELKQKQIIIEGLVESISEKENEEYWSTYPKEAQIRFSAYAPTSSQPISSKEILEAKKQEINLQYKDSRIPVDPLYCGFRLKPNRFAFYAYQTPELSDTFEYIKDSNSWTKRVLSP